MQTEAGQEMPPPVRNEWPPNKYVPDSSRDGIAMASVRANMVWTARAFGTSEPSAAGTVRAPNKAIAIVNNFCPESVEPSAKFLASAHSCRSRVHSVPSFLAQTLSLERSSASLCFVYLVNPRR